MDDETREPELDIRAALVDMLYHGGATILANATDRGNPGVLVTLPNGRVMAVYLTYPVHTYVTV